MTPPVPIRPARLADLPGIQDIITACYAPYIQQIGRRPAPMDDDYAAHIAAKQLWVAAERDKVFGLVVLVAQRNALLVDNIAVAPAAQGRGVFRTLMRFAETIAHGQDLPAIILYTHAKMTRNLSLYPKLGYVETHHEIQSGFDRVFFRKALTAQDDCS